MVYITGNTNKEYHVEGILLPKRHYREEELARGRHPVLKLDEIQYGKIVNHKIFTSLVEQKIIRVSDEAPVDLINTPNELRQEIVSHQEEILRLKADLERAQAGDTSGLTKELDAVKAEARALIEQLRAENAALKTENDELNKLMAEDE